MPIHAPNGGFGGFYPINKEQSHRGPPPPKKKAPLYASLCRSTTYYIHTVKISPPIFAERPYTLQWSAPAHPKKIAPFHWVSGPSSNMWFLWPTRIHNPNSISIGSAVFAGLKVDCPYTLQWAETFPFKTGLPWGSGPHLTDGSLRPPEPITHRTSQSVHPFLQDSNCDRQTDRQTYRPHYSVCNKRPHLAYAAMWPNNNNIHLFRHKVRDSVAISNVITLTKPYC